MTWRLVQGHRPDLELEPRLLTNVNGALLFVADDGLQSNELRRSDGTDARSDGTDAGTTLVAGRLKENAHLQAFSFATAAGRAALLLPARAPSMPTEATKDADLQAVYEDGSDGTRTRDLRRDRPVQAQPVGFRNSVSRRWDSVHQLDPPQDSVSRRSGG